MIDFGFIYERIKLLIQRIGYMKLATRIIQHMTAAGWDVRVERDGARVEITATKEGRSYTAISPRGLEGANYQAVCQLARTIGVAIEMPARIGPRAAQG